MSLSVLAVETPDVCNWNNVSDTCELAPAALGKPYKAPPYELRIAGATRPEEVVFRIPQASSSALLWQSGDNGMSAEVTRNILINTDRVGLRLLGVPTQQGNHQFSVIAESKGAASVAAATMVNTRVFHLKVFDCLDEYDSCGNNGKCKVGDNVNNLDGKVDCDCAAGFLSDDKNNGRCTKPASPLVVTCPCDMQLASVRDEAQVEAPEQFWASIYEANKGSAKLEITRADEKPVVEGAQQPFAVGNLTLITVKVISSDGKQSKECQVVVGVAAIRSEIDGVPLLFMKNQIISDKLPVSVNLDPAGVVPGYDVAFALESASIATSQVRVMYVLKEAWLRG